MYIVLFLFTCIWVFIFINNKNESIYDLNDNEFILRISNIKEADDKVTLYLDGYEELVGTYYLKDGENPSFNYGDLIKIKGNLKIPSNNTIPYTFNYKKYLKRKGINYILTINSYEILEEAKGLYDLKNSIVKRINQIDSTGYMKAFIIGDKSLIDEDNYSDYQDIGITHLFALSGMHIGLLSEILLKLLKRLKIALKYAIIDTFLVVYGFIVCFPASIQRCIIFYLISSLNKVFDLGIDNKKILLLTICVLILLDHFIIFDTGFLFSVFTVGGIIFCSNFIKDNNKLKEAFKLSLVAFLFSLPISLYSFYQINLLSIFYNMLFIPFISLIVYPLSLLSFIFPFLNSLFQLSINLLERSSTLLSSIKLFNIWMSFNIMEVIGFYIGLFLFFNKQQKIYLCCLLLIVIIDILVPYLDSSSYVYFLDVKQGDASLVILPYRKGIYMIDTGGVQNYPISDNYLSMFKYLGINRIDYLILTHGDYDHMGEAINLVNNFKVEKVIFNCGSYNELEQELIKVLNKKKTSYYSCIKELNINNNKLYFLHTKEYDNENDNSNVIYTELDGYKFMFMGDASTTTEKEILDKYNLPDIDVLKVGHHGSRTSSSKEFLDEIEPKYSIISVGKNNRYGHPNKEVLETLKDTKIYRTDQDGSIMFKNKNNELEMKICSP